jgi:hypothetical protein
VSQCETVTEGRSHRRGPACIPERAGHRCIHPARFRVQAADRHGGVDPSAVAAGGEYVCGTHVRPALMDNGDSVWKPWIVTRLEA